MATLVALAERERERKRKRQAEPSAFPPCKYAAHELDGRRACSLLDTMVRPCECAKYIEAAACDGRIDTTGAVAGTGHFRVGHWRAIVLNWPGKKMVDGFADSLEALGWEVTRLRRGGEPDWKDTCIEAIRRLRPQLLVTQQRFYEQHKPGKCQFAGQVGRACQRYNVATLIVDFGVAAGQEHYGVSIFDPAGDNAESSIVGNLDAFLASPTEREAIEAAHPKVDALRAALAQRADQCPPALLRKYGLADLPARFAFLILQKSNDAVLRFDGCGKPKPKPLVDAVAARCRELGLYCVAKPHPFEYPGELPAKGVITGGRILPRMGGLDNHLVSAWLLKHAACIVTVNSTMQYQAMALGTPIVTLGRGWFSDNGVTHEQAERAASKFTLPPAPNAERCRDFLALMMSRQLTAPECEQPGKVEALVRRLLPTPGRSAITTIYAANEAVGDVGKRSLLATVQAVDGPVIAATDKGVAGFNGWCKSNNVRYVTVRDGEPPRMNRLMGEALDHAAGDLVWTIESDVLVDRHTLRNAESLLRGLPADVASLSLETVDERGRRNFPSSVDIARRTVPADAGLLRVIEADGRKPYNCFAATLWRYHALARVDWSACRPLIRCDVDAGAQLHDAGWVHMVAPGLTATHYPHMSTQRKAPTITPLVSVVVLTCGRLATTRRWLPAALERLGHDRVERLFWDNGSADGTPEFLRELERDGDTLCLHHENIGKRALPQILQQCRGEYLLELDDDIEVPDGFLAAMLAAFEKCPRELGTLGLDYIWQVNREPFSARWEWSETYKAGDDVFLAAPGTARKLAVPGACRLTPMAVARRWAYPRPYATDTPLSQQTSALGLWRGILSGVQGEKFVHHCGPRSAATVRGAVYHDGHDAR
ncbi:MAG TPA: glycosyltransferase [Phycisphaerae bacterium]|nr:glycosyltransferase [Phycisphaerae bacterium]